MDDLSTCLKTQVVARALGVSVSTVKRWVDTGTIRASRTVGRHRLIPREEAIRVANELKLGRVRFDSAELKTGEFTRTRDRLQALLSEDKVEEARQLLKVVHASGIDAAILADEIIRPVMSWVGHGWLVGTTEVYQEHQISQLIGSTVQEMVRSLPLAVPGVAPLALGASPEGDPYVMGMMLGELVLRQLGWEVRNLGANLPLASLAKAVREYRPRLVYLSINLVGDHDRFTHDYAAFYQLASEMDVAVIVGGHALGGDLRSRLDYTAHGDRMRHLAEFARRLTSGTGNAVTG